MNNILTADEYFAQLRPIIDDKGFSLSEKMKYISELAKKFATLHVENALESAVERLPYDDKMNQDMMTRSAILKSYSITNIK
jgi:hypothetical protein